MAWTLPHASLQADVLPTIASADDFELPCSFTTPPIPGPDCLRFPEGGPFPSPHVALNTLPGDPTDAQDFDVGQAVTVSFDCPYDAARFCDTWLDGPGITFLPLRSGDTLPTATVGIYTVHLFTDVCECFTDADGNQIHNDIPLFASAVYVVTPPPPIVIKLRSPQDGRTYAKGSTLVANYDCLDTIGSKVTCQGYEQTAGIPVEHKSGDHLDTSQSGSRSFTVFAFNTAGDEAEQTVNYAVQDYDVTLSANRDLLWANGHDPLQLTAHVADTDGAPVQGARVDLGWSRAGVSRSETGVKSPSTRLLTDAQGDAVFKKITATKTGSVDFVVALDNRKTAVTSVSFGVHKLVVQVAGVRTSLPSKYTGCDSGGDADNFNPIRAALIVRPNPSTGQRRGFTCKDFLWYSYRGGHTDAETGEWSPNFYNCRDTGRDYRLTIQALAELLSTVGRENPNTEFEVVGHSQGGLMGIQAVGIALAHMLPKTTTLDTVQTLDAPLGGAPAWGVKIMSEFRPCSADPEDAWKGPATRQMVELNDSVTIITTAADTADVLGCVVGYALSCTGGPGLLDQAAAFRATGGTLVNYGAYDDAVYDLTACVPDVPRLTAFDNRSTQVLTGFGSFAPYNGNFPQITGLDLLRLHLLALVDRASACISNSHAAVISAQSDAVASVIGDQPTPRADAVPQADGGGERRMDDRTTMRAAGM